MFSDLVYRLRAIFCRRSMETDLDEEIRLHVQRETEAAIERGVPPEEARRRARLALGGQEQTREACRDARGVALVESLLQDVRYAARVLRKSRGYSAAAILTLALGIGATTAIFTIVNSFLLRPLPVQEPDRLVAVREDDPQRPVPFLATLAWEQIRDRPQLFQSVCGWMPALFNLAERGEADLVQGIWVSGRFFETLGVPAILGRTFTAADDRQGGGPDGPVAVISYGYLQRRFGGAADAVGRSLTLNRVSYTIVGVTPPDFFGPMTGRSFDVALPLGVADGQGWVYALARLGPGQTPESATAALRAVQPQIREATLSAAVEAGVQASRWLSQPLSVTSAATGTATPLRDRFQRPLLAMLLLAGLVVLVACGNVANLVLARATARRHELSVRRALGASRARLARQVLVESLLLSVVGAALGLVFAQVFCPFLVRQISTATSPASLDLSLDWRVLTFTAGISVCTALLFGLVPALRAARVQPNDALKEGGRTRVGDQRWGVNQALIVGQVGLSVVLVVAAGLFVRTFSTMATMDLGFDRSRTVIVSLNLQDARVPPPARVVLYDRLRQAVAAVPGVADAVALRTTPVSSDHWVQAVRVAGREPPAVAATLGPFLNAVSPGYFATFGAPILAGRGFTDRDVQGTPPAAVVNETFARVFNGGRNPVGETLTFGPRASSSPPFQIVGLARDAGSATYFGLRQGIPPTVYLCISQMNPAVVNFTPPAEFRIGVRLTGSVSASVTRGIAAAIGNVEPDLRVRMRTMADYIDGTLMAERLAAILAGLFGSLALILAGVGIFGVTAYAVSRRRAEIGLRLALGASTADVVRTVLQRVVILVSLGLVIGGAVSFWTSRLVGALLFGLEPRDPATFAGAAAVLAAGALLAGWLPARRAARIDPAIVLRSE